MIEHKMLALSIVSPHGRNIAEGRKTLEVRSWAPAALPVYNLLIVENDQYLTKNNPEDENGRPVAIVDVLEAHDWKPDEVQAACSAGWQPGYHAWVLANVRSLNSSARVPAKRKLYEVQFNQACGDSAA